jgi:hypothetical protein
MPVKPLVFISHIAEEKEIGLSLKALVDKTFLHMIDVFVSSDSTSIEMGRLWFEKITHALKTCAVEIILASPESVKQPWINFETGCGYIREINVIPFCHSGIVPANLPAPLRFLQSGLATDVQDLKKLFPLLAKAIDCSLPAVDFAPFIATVKQFEADSRDMRALAAMTPIATTDGISALERTVFLEIANLVYSPSHSVRLDRLHEGLSEGEYRAFAINLAMKMLDRKGLIEFSTEKDFRDEDYAAVKVTDQGWQWLEANRDGLLLTHRPPEPEPHPSVPEDDEVPF